MARVETPDGGTLIPFHYRPGSSNLTPNLLLEPIGARFRLVLVERTSAAHKSPAYLKRNPDGLIPVRVDGDFALEETAAICLIPADRIPEKQLAHPLVSRKRAPAVRRLFTSQKLSTPLI